MKVAVTVHHRFMGDIEMQQDNPDADYTDEEVLEVVTDFRSILVKMDALNFLDVYNTHHVVNTKDIAISIRPA